MGREKNKLSLVVIGHVSSGKSTTFGQLVHKLGAISDRDMTILKADVARWNKGTMQYAWVFDKQDHERENGFSVFSSVRNFETFNNLWTVSVTPGNRVYIKETIKSTSRADCAVLMIDSTCGGFKAGMSKEGRGQAVLAFTLGVKQMVCCINKMDATTPKYSKSRYDDIVKEVSLYLKKVGYNPDKIPFVPISGFEGDNMIEKSSNLHWYMGPTLFEALNQVSQPRSCSDMPLRLPLQRVINNAGKIEAEGRVETGTLKTGELVIFGPHGLTNRVTSIKINDRTVREAYPGNQVRFGLFRPLPSLEQGNVASKSHPDPAKGTVSFTANIVTVDMFNIIFEGETILIDFGSYRSYVKLVDLVTRRNRGSGEDLEFASFKYLKDGDAYTVTMKPTKPMVVETLSDYPPMGRFSVIDKRLNTNVEIVVAVGIITSVEKEDWSMKDLS